MAQEKLLIQNGTLLLPGGTKQNSDLLIAGDKIVQIAPKIDASSASKVIDASDLLVMPGIIDTQVHFREPGLEHKEDLHTGSKAAVLGGFQRGL